MPKNVGWGIHRRFGLCNDGRQYEKYRQQKMGYRLSAGFLVYFTLTVALAVYFAFAAVKGDLGVIERLTAKAELADLTAQKQRLQLQVDEMANKSRRLSDTFLDLDLLDERARDVLGVMRANELTIR